MWGKHSSLTGLTDKSYTLNKNQHSPPGLGTSACTRQVADGHVFASVVREIYNVIGVQPSNWNLWLRASRTLETREHQMRIMTWYPVVFFCASFWFVDVINASWMGPVRTPAPAA